AALQVVEYDRTFASAKFFFNKIKGNAIISGAFGLFRKNVVIDAGGYSSDAIGEDMELVMKLSAFCIEHGIPYKIDYIPSAICWTQRLLKTCVIYEARETAGTSACAITSTNTDG
ncbi:MAG TPA: glycosyltransferase family 2 protein, partial [Bacilli bacterium]|nr:glycosyltransferase family 2 protein [Bacilli bacterium]